MKTVVVNQFDGGMTSDARDISSKAQLIQHFDNHTSKYKLTPYKSTSSAYASQSTAKIERMLMYNSKMYGYGITPGGFPELYESTDLHVPNFTASSSGSGATYTADFGLFVEYRGYLYGGNGLRYIWQYNIGTPGFSETKKDLSAYTNLGGGLVHSKDDIMYIAVDNKIYYQNDGGSDGSGTITLGLTLPTNMIISSICEYGNYLAIACRPKYRGAVNSRVFLWDRDTSLTTTSESIDWGNNDLFVIETIDGVILGVSLMDMTGDVTGHKLIFSQYSGGGAVNFETLPLGSYYSTSLPYFIRHKQKFNNRMYFGLGATSMDNNGQSTGDFTGVWSVGRNNPTSPFSVRFDRLPNDDTFTLRINGFLMVNNFAYISYVQTDGTTYGLSQTINASTYNATSKFRFTINPNMSPGDKILKKQLKTVAVTYSPLPTAGQVVLKYRVDTTPQTAWSSATTVFTETTDNAQATEVQNAGGTQFTAGRDYEFEVQSTGGAEITGLIYKYEILSTLL